MGTKLISSELIGQLPREAARAWGDRKALVYKDRSWTYRDFETEVQGAAAALLAAGVRPGERVALWLPNSPELQFLLFAVTRIGAVAVPLNTRYKSMDLRYALQLSECVMVVGASQAGPVDLDAVLVAAVADGRPAALRHIVMIGGSRLSDYLPWSAFLDAGRPYVADNLEPQIRFTDTAMMLFTSGTTGQPKGVLLNHAGLRLCHDRAKILQMNEHDVQLTYLPLFHIYAFGYSVLMSFMAGAMQILMETFKGDDALKLIEQHRVTVMHGFEAHFSDMLAAQRRSSHDVSSLRISSFASGSESAVELARQVQDELCETSSSYGLTETWGGISISPPGATLSQRCEASGLPQPGIEVRIVDPVSGHVLPNNTVGEIQVRSYALFTGYHGDPAATRAAMDEGGWFRTGDAGLLRDDGYMRCVARYKDILKVGGENVAPAEIEGLLTQIPGVRAAAVIGQKHERLQEVPVAFVIADGDSRPSETEIIEYFRGKIANFKIPSRVFFVEELPMTPTGKIQKEILRQRLSGES